MEETKKFFDTFNMMEMQLDNNIMSIKKDGYNETLVFEIHNFGKTLSVTFTLSGILP